MAQDKSSVATAKPESLTVANKRYDAAKELGRLSKKYSLTDEQKAKIQPILIDQQKQVHTLGEDESLSNAEWNAEVRKAHRAAVLAIKAQMSDAQASKYVKDEDKLAKKSDDGNDDGDFGPPDGPPPGGGPGGPGGGPPPGE